MSSHRLALPVWSLFRIVVGLLFLCHGLATVFGVLGGARGTGQAVAAGTWPGWYAGLIQLVCGALVLAGLATRPAAILASGSMAYAYFSVHQPDGLWPIENGGVNAALYAWVFLAIAVIGPGPWSLDELIARRRRGTVAAPSAPDPVLAADRA
ncbi:integral membrane protein [Actinoplanes sp. NBRC 14428]|uniref:Putative oxidoreductase n=1 Tax=Pseudosporangium ferrugineum TaxID=439699 RepID=A0A2T0RRZ0_9ACTN|nr:DoxX family protein [Pseudosporangium ferrugineum]PRY23938.1 putative oxidoreductase [Pseudosporangium ferrugineum]BCJ51501.1 integral membrane protein [Actinoplanes sp. NBRC 14428]